MKKIQNEIENGIQFWILKLKITDEAVRPESISVLCVLLLIKCLFFHFKTFMFICKWNVSDEYLKLRIFILRSGVI